MSNEPHPSATMPASSDRLQIPGRSNHPRRVPAHSSVSLRHPMASGRTMKGKTLTSSSVRQQPSSSHEDGSPSSLRPRGERNSSGESSNAENWFDKTNNGVREGHGTLGDQEPPFFIRNPSSLETPPDGQQLPSHRDGATDSLPVRAGLLQPGRDGNGLDHEFRMVIDDLTVQNKKLKRRLKKYEQLHDAHLKDDKLFEVKIHGLPPEKKRELEEMLRKFASSLGTANDNAFPTDGYNTLLPMLEKKSSHATLQQSDSAYASMSRSGPGSSAVSGVDDKQKNTPLGHQSARQRNIQSYLHDIPIGLLPHQAPANMTERAKKKLVVRKLEQLFVGKGAVGGHQQPLQQQEVSQNAAQADRSARARAGQSARAYGAREAPMLARKKSDDDQDVLFDDAVTQGPQEKPLNGTGKTFGALDAEQRPTEPIDLDPDRAQIPQDNIKYMRGMGFSPPHPDAAPEDGHGWIYINFLFNMAQLHTLHVTIDFVREAMSDISKKLEVSSDGRKVRWRGGKSATHVGSSGDGTPENGLGNDLDNGQSPRKRLKTAHGGSSNWSSAQAMGGMSSRVKDSVRHAYTPMFHHKSSLEGSGDSSSDEEHTEDYDMRWDNLGDSSGMPSSGMQPNTPFNAAGLRRKKPRRNDGPIIFYNNVRFCTDLSGERRPMANNNVPRYTTFAAHPIGDRCDPDSDVEGRGPLAEAGGLPEPMDVDDNPTGGSHDLSFPSASSPPASTLGQTDQKPIDLEVTGIGGVWPEDNFMLNVETRHAPVGPEDSVNDSALAVSKALSPHLANILASSKARNQPLTKIGCEVTDVEVRKLPPSELPPALGYMDYDDDTSSEDSQEEDDTSSNPHAQDALPPEVSTQPVDFGYRYASEADEEEEDEEEDDSDEDSDDGEVDLLAGIRAANPEFVRAQERVYDANIAERLADEIPMGSSAATAGGGSGFASPAFDAAKDVWQTSPALGARAPPPLDKGGTGNSMAVQGVDGS